MRYVNVLRRLLSIFYQLPRHPYSPYYARWETVMHQHRLLLCEQAEAARQLRALGLITTANGWALPAPLRA